MKELSSSVMEIIHLIISMAHKEVASLLEHQLQLQHLLLIQHAGLTKLETDVHIVENALVKALEVVGAKELATALRAKRCCWHATPLSKVNLRFHPELGRS